MSVPLTSQMKEQERLTRGSFIDSRSLDGFNIHVLDSANESQLINLNDIPANEVKKRKGAAAACRNHMNSLLMSDTRRQASVGPLPGTKTHAIRSI